MSEREPEFRSGEVDYTFEDLRSLARLNSSLALRIARIFGWALLIVATATFAFSRLLATPYGVADFLYCLASGLALVILGSPTSRAYFWLWQQRRSRLYKPQSFTVRATGLEVESSLGRGEMKWPVFTRLIRNDDRLFLFVTKRSAYIVPRRAFASDSEFDAFGMGAVEHWKRAQDS